MIHKLNLKLNFTFFILCRNLICCKTLQSENVTDHFELNTRAPTLTSFLIWFCLSHLSPQLTSWHHEDHAGVEQSHSCQSYNRMKGLLWWRWRLSGPGAIPPDGSDHKHHQEGTGLRWWCSHFCPDQTSRFTFPIIWILVCAVKTITHTWTGWSLETQKTCSSS